MYNVHVHVQYITLYMYMYIHVHTCTCIYAFPGGVLGVRFVITSSVVLCIHQSDEGYWKGGIFHFEVNVPEDYNNKVHCVYEDTYM